MKAKKIKLKEIQIQSFITKLNGGENMTILGQQLNNEEADGGIHVEMFDKPKKTKIILRTITCPDGSQIIDSCGLWCGCN